MERIDSRTVEFTTIDEINAKERFDTALNEGLSITAAARRSLAMGLAEGARYSAVFVEYLSENTVIVTKGRAVVATPKGREFP